LAGGSGYSARMTMLAPNPYAGHRFPPEIISHAVWLYFPSAPDGRFVRFIENDPPANMSDPVAGARLLAGPGAALADDPHGHRGCWPHEPQARPPAPAR
jgi:hypothetical protein